MEKVFSKIGHPEGDGSLVTIVFKAKPCRGVGNELVGATCRVLCKFVEAPNVRYVLWAITCKYPRKSQTHRGEPWFEAEVGRLGGVGWEVPRVPGHVLNFCKCSYISPLFACGQ